MKLSHSSYIIYKKWTKDKLQLSLINNLAAKVTFLKAVENLLY